MKNILMLTLIFIISSCARMEYNRHLTKAKYKLTEQCIIEEGKDKEYCQNQAELQIKKFKDMIGDKD
jgi:hypothetical protein